MSVPRKRKTDPEKVLADALEGVHLKSLQAMGHLEVLIFRLGANTPPEKLAECRELLEAQRADLVGPLSVLIPTIAPAWLSRINHAEQLLALVEKVN